MIEIFGHLYYLDFEQIDLFLGWDPNLQEGEVKETQTVKVLDNLGQVVTTEETETKTQKPKEINAVRFDLIRNFIDDLKDAGDVTDPDETTVAFKLAFNTLTAYRILKEFKD